MSPSSAPSPSWPPASLDQTKASVRSLLLALPSPPPPPPGPQDIAYYAQNLFMPNVSCRLVCCCLLPPAAPAGRGRGRSGARAGVGVAQATGDSNFRGMRSVRHAWRSEGARWQGGGIATLARPAPPCLQILSDLGWAPPMNINDPSSVCEPAACAAWACGAASSNSCACWAWEVHAPRLPACAAGSGAQLPFSWASAAPRETCCRLPPTTCRQPHVLDGQGPGADHSHGNLPGCASQTAE